MNKLEIIKHKKPLGETQERRFFELSMIYGYRSWVGVVTQARGSKHHQKLKPTINEMFYDIYIWITNPRQLK